MDYTIKELTDGNAVVVFADDSWANVSVMTNDTKATFEERVQGYAPKATVPNPSWIAAGQTGSVGQTSPVLPAASFSYGEDSDNPAWLNARKAAYGSMASQLEFITENGLEAWQEEVAAIKLAHPIV